MENPDQRTFRMTTYLERYAKAIAERKGNLTLADVGDDDQHIRILRTRAAVDQPTVDDYQAAYSAKGGDPLPPVHVWQVGERLLLTAGEHRILAAQAAGIKTLPAKFFKGTDLQALEDGIADNARHGRRRTPEDNRVAIEKLMAFPEYETIGDRELARLLGCSPTTIGKYRPKKPEVVTGRDGREYNTTNLRSETKKAAAEKPKRKAVAKSDEPPLCAACFKRDAVDGIRCQECIDAGVEPDEPEGLADYQLDNLAYELWQEGDDSKLLDLSPSDRSTVLGEAVNSLGEYISWNCDRIPEPWMSASQRKHIDDLTAKLRKALQALKRPHVCPKCDGAATGCGHCEGTGLVTKVARDSLVEAKKATTKKAAATKKGTMKKGAPQ